MKKEINKTIYKREIGLTSVIILITLISLAYLATAQNSFLQNPYYYNLELYYNKGDIEISSAEIVFSNEEKTNINKDNSYYLEITDSEKRILNKVFFSIPNFVIYDFVDEKGNFIATNESGLKTLENVSFNVFAPYYKNGHEVVVYNKNGKELDKSFVSQFSKTNFNKQDFTESEIENGINKSSDEEVKERSNPVSDYKNYIIVLSLVLIILIIILIYFLRKRK